MPESTGMTAVMKYFGLKPADFSKAWKKMSDQEKAALKDAIGTFDETTGEASGSLDY